MIWAKQHLEANLRGKLLPHKISQDETQVFRTSIDI